MAEEEYQNRGYVYVLSNPSMPGVVKIGQSKVGGKHRAQQMYTTGVPEPFHLEFEVMADEPEYLESVIHDNLSGERVNGSREFFRMETEEAINQVMYEWANQRDMALIDADLDFDPSFLWNLSQRIRGLGEWMDPREIVHLLVQYTKPEQVVDLARVRDRILASRNCSKTGGRHATSKKH